MTATAPAPPSLFDPEHVLDPWPGLAILRDHYPVYFEESLGCWLISRYEDIRPINKKFGPGPVYQELLGRFLSHDTTVYFALEGQDHRRRRALLTPFFARGGVDRLRDRIENQVRALLEPIFERERQAVAAGERERGEMDFVTEFCDIYSINVMADILGLDVEDHDRVLKWLEAWLGAEGNISGDPKLYERAEWAKKDFTEYILPIIADRRTSEADDLISVLAHAEIEGVRLPDDEIQSFVAVMILAGGETTGHQLGWLMRELVRHPDAQRDLIADRGLMDKVLAEGMRYCSIIQYSGRTVTEDIEVGGVKIESGAPLAMMLAAGNHDPRRFQNAEEFDIHRTDLDAAKAFAGSADHLAFGGGSHFCLGSHVSKAEMDIALSVFFDNVRDVRFAEGFEPHAKPDAPYVRTLPSLKLSFELL